MYEMIFCIEGIADYIQDKFLPEVLFPDKPTNKYPYPTEDWAHKVYFNADTGFVYIPREQMIQCVYNAAKKVKVGKTTCGKLSKAILFILEEKIDIDRDKPDYIKVEDIPNGRGQRIMNYKPTYKAGYKAQFTISCIDPDFPDEKLKEIIEKGGTYIGIGNQRPVFGRFKIVECGVSKKAKKNKK